MCSGQIKACGERLTWCCTVETDQTHYRVVFESNNKSIPIPTSRSAWHVWFADSHQLVPSGSCSTRAWASAAAAASQSRSRVNCAVIGVTPSSTLSPPRSIPVPQRERIFKVSAHHHSLAYCKSLQLASKRCVIINVCEQINLSKENTQTIQIYNQRSESLARKISGDKNLESASELAFSHLELFTAVAHTNNHSKSTDVILGQVDVPETDEVQKHLSFLLRQCYPWWSERQHRRPAGRELQMCVVVLDSLGHLSTSGTHIQILKHFCDLQTLASHTKPAVKQQYAWIPCNWHRPPCGTWASVLKASWRSPPFPLPIAPYKSNGHFTFAEHAEMTHKVSNMATFFQIEPCKTMVNQP